MRRIAHGSTSPLESEGILGAETEEISLGFNFLPPPASSPGLTPFGYLFPNLANDPAELLPESQETLKNLFLLGETMREPGNNLQFSTIPSAYTYFGQFLDHDIAFTEVKKPAGVTDSCVLDDPQLAPWPVADVLAKVTNQRASILELDSVYGGDPSPPRYGSLMILGKVSAFPPHHHQPNSKEDDHDLPRQGMSSKYPKLDRAALIGDPRNDQNLMISQLHLAFLRAHNAIVKKGHTLEEARTLLRQHYHWIIINDYLKKVADPIIVDQVLADPHPIYPPAGKFFLPLEFTVAAFRFGHSMIRSSYYINRNFLAGGIPLHMLFTLTALSDNIAPTYGKGFPSLPENRIIEWRRFLEGGDNAARRIDTQMVNPLFALLDETEQPVLCERSLAVQDLKRGYMLRMPTGQAIAQTLKVQVMSAQEIEAVAVNEAQRNVLRNSGFSSRTPLWFYILAEASQGGGNRLGPVGSHLVARVLIGLVRRSANSILDPNLSSPGWVPTLGTVEGTFALPDLLRLAGVLENK